MVWKLLDGKLQAGNVAAKTTTRRVGHRGTCGEFCLLIARGISGKEHPMEFVLIGNALGFAFQGGFFPSVLLFIAVITNAQLSVAGSTLRRGAVGQHRMLLATHTTGSTSTYLQALLYPRAGSVPGCERTDPSQCFTSPNTGICWGLLLVGSVCHSFELVLSALNPAEASQEPFWSSLSLPAI